MCVLCAVFVAARELIVLSFEIMSVLGLWTGGRRGRKRDKRVPHVLAILPLLILSGDALRAASVPYSYSYPYEAVIRVVHSSLSLIDTPGRDIE